MRIVTVRGSATKLCPYRDERDHGTVKLTFAVAGDAPDLHDIAAGIAGYANQQMSHEDFTAAVFTHWEDCRSASSTWHTAGLEVTVDVSRDEH